MAQQAHLSDIPRALGQSPVSGHQRTIEHLGESDIRGVVIRESMKRSKPQRDVGVGQLRRYNLQGQSKEFGDCFDGQFDWWARTPKEEDVPDLVVKKRWDDDLRSSFDKVGEQRLGLSHIVFGCDRYEPLECDGGVNDQIDQRRPRSRASSASAVVIGLRCSA